MRVLMTEDSNSAVSNSFLLDDDSRYDQELYCIVYFESFKLQYERIITVFLEFHECYLRILSSTFLSNVEY